MVRIKVPTGQATPSVEERALHEALGTRALSKLVSVVHCGGQAAIEGTATRKR